MTIPQQRPHTDGVDHPAWCVPALCERGPADVVHRGVGELFAPRAAASDARAPELCLEVRRLRRDELGAGGVQRVHGDEVELVRVSDGETVAVVAVEDVPRLCAVLAGGASALV